MNNCLLLVGLLAGGCMMPMNRGAAQPSSSSPSSSGESVPTSGAMPEATPAAAPAPSGPQVVSVTLHNDCSNTVKLFLGEKPKFGSGTNTSLGSNTTTSYQMKPGDMIWITDDSENGLSSTTIGNGSSQSIKITSSCTGFGPY